MAGRGPGPGAGTFFLALLTFAVVYFLLPDKVRSWFALIIVLGAVAYAGNIGALERVEAKLGGKEVIR